MKGNNLCILFCYMYDNSVVYFLQLFILYLYRFWRRGIKVSAWAQEHVIVYTLKGGCLACWRLQDRIPAVAELHRFILCTKRSGVLPKRVGECDQSIGSTVSDAIVRSWLWSTATRSSLLGLQQVVDIDLTLCGSWFSTGRLLAIEDFTFYFSEWYKFRLLPAFVCWCLTWWLWLIQMPWWSCVVWWVCLLFGTVNYVKEIEPKC